MATTDGWFEGVLHEPTGPRGGLPITILTAGRSTIRRQVGPRVQQGSLHFRLARYNAEGLLGGGLELVTPLPDALEVMAYPL